jgi:hypothetical protein|tara:strand:+ start:2074 stop:2382 length:309 start_codon:yes stop_codon:yes gene_type:complete
LAATKKGSCAAFFLLFISESYQNSIVLFKQWQYAKYGLLLTQLLMAHPGPQGCQWRNTQHKPHYVDKQHSGITKSPAAVQIKDNYLWGDALFGVALSASARH